MKIRVISEFYDKFHTSTLFKVGTVLDFDDERAKDIISKKLAEPYSEPEKKPEPKLDLKPEPIEEKRKPGRPKAEVKEDAKTDEKEKAEVVIR